jgi:hypothetical protein
MLLNTKKLIIKGTAISKQVSSSVIWKKLIRTDLGVEGKTLHRALMYPVNKQLGDMTRHFAILAGPCSSSVYFNFLEILLFSSRLIS